MSDSTLYLYTSLTAGSSHIVTATARIETILKANKLPFRAIDVATDEAARKLWGRRSKGKKLPGLVKYGNIVGDLEEIEEWNEFGELRMVVNSAPDLDGMPATSYPAAAPAATQQTPKEPEPKTPKPSTIKIQSPPSKTAETEKKDSTAVLALRQASAEAASKAKSKTEDKKDAKPTPDTDRTASTSPSTTHRKGSVAPELPDTAPDSPTGAKRPALVPEEAAVSSANFHADNAEMMGLVSHHRGSIISEGNKEEHDKAVHEIRASISKEDPAGSIAALRKEAAEKEKRPSETIEESPLAEDATVEDEKTEKPAEDKKEAKDEAKPAETKPEKKDVKDEAKPAEAKPEEKVKDEE